MFLLLLWCVRSRVAQLRGKQRKPIDCKWKYIEFRWFYIKKKQYARWAFNSVDSFPLIVAIIIWFHILEKGRRELETKKSETSFVNWSLFRFVCNNFHQINRRTAHYDWLWKCGCLNHKCRKPKFPQLNRIIHTFTHTHTHMCIAIETQKFHILIVCMCCRYTYNLHHFPFVLESRSDFIRPFFALYFAEVNEKKWSVCVHACVCE